MHQFEYQISIMIDVPRLKVIETYLDYDQFKHYQEPPFVTHNLIEGKTYEPGAVTELVYQYKDDYIIVKEKIIACNLPEGMTQLFVIGNVKQKCTHHFIESGQKTLWKMHVFFQISTNDEIDK